MTRVRWFTAALLACLLLQSSQGLRADEKKARVPSFGSLDAVSADAARTQALDWLKSVGKTDAATTAEFDRIWKREDRSVLDRTADTLALGDATAKKLLDEARNPLAHAPTAVPAVLTDNK